jgi:hypothetical protein
MRSESGAYGTIEYPNAATYSKAGNYIRVVPLAANNTNRVTLKLFNNLGTAYALTLSRVVVSNKAVVFPLDGVFEAWTEIAKQQNRAYAMLQGIEITAFGGTRQTGDIMAGVRIFRAAVADGTELPALAYEPEVAAPEVLKLYPELPHKIEAIASAPASGFWALTRGDNLVTYNTTEAGWSLVSFNASSVLADDVTEGNTFLQLRETPTSLGAFAVPIEVDKCREGFLVTWLDPSGVHKAYRFPKGSAGIDAKDADTYYTFDSLLRPRKVAERTAERTVSVFAPYINANDRAYLQGLALGTEVAVLDIAAYDVDNSTAAIPVLVSDYSTEDNGQPLQTFSFALTYDLPTL